MLPESLLSQAAVLTTAIWAVTQFLRKFPIIDEAFNGISGETVALVSTLSIGILAIATGELTLSVESISLLIGASISSQIVHDKALNKINAL